MTCEEELAEKGWEKQVTLDEPRLSEVIEMYEEIDFEIHVEPFNPETETGCTQCMRQSPEKYKTIYTRPKP